MAAPEFREEAAAAYQARKELGPEYEDAVLESFVDRAAETIDKRVQAQLAEHGVGRTPQPRQGGEDGQLPLAFFSVFFGVGGSIGLTAGADAEPVVLFIMWAGIVLVNAAYAGRKKSR